MKNNYLGRIAQYGLIALVSGGSAVAYASRVERSALEHSVSSAYVQQARDLKQTRNPHSLEGYLLATVSDSADSGSSDASDSPDAPDSPDTSDSPDADKNDSGPHGDASFSFESGSFSGHLSGGCNLAGDKDSAGSGSGGSESRGNDR